MGKVFYQPIVLKNAKYLISIFRETGFFEENKIESEDFAMEYMCDKLTEKFITGELDDEIDSIIFNEKEIDTYLGAIIAQNILNSLKNKGLLYSIENENNEERFFSTPLGKAVATTIKRQKEKV